MTHLDFDTVVRLTRARRSGQGEYRGRCPAHEDRTPSLSIGTTASGELLLHCFAGCDYQRVRDALLGTTGGAHEVGQRVPHHPAGPRRVVARYTYRDEHGEALFEVRRYEPKDFRQFRPDGTPGVRDVRVAPYNLPAVQRATAAAGRVYLVEGEKDVESLGAIGLVATCNAGGAGKWRDEHTEALAGVRDVVILPDNDDAGRQHAARVARSLAQLDPAPSVRVVELPGIEPKGDVTDWLAEGGTREALEALVQAAPIWVAAAVADDENRSATIGAQLEVITLSSVEPVEVRWLWPNRLPAGKLWLLDGDPGVGKSLLTMHLAACVTTGAPLPDGARTSPSDVLMVALEDGVADTLAPRAIAAGVDRDRLHVIAGVTDVAGRSRAPQLPQDVPLIETAVRRTAAQLVIIDPLTAYLGGQTDSYKDQDVRAALLPVARMAESTGTTVLIVRHLPKRTAGKAITAGAGSIGIVGIARGSWLLTRDPADDQRRVLAVSKSNLAAPAPALAFHLEQAKAGPAVVWDGEVAYTADDLVAARESSGTEETSALEEACDWLREFLERGGPKPKKDVLRAAHADGISQRTLERAKGTLRVTHQRDGFGGGYVWALPDQIEADRAPEPRPAACSPQPDMLATDADVGGVGEQGGVGEHTPVEPLDRTVGDDDPDEEWTV